MNCKVGLVSRLPRLAPRPNGDAPAALARRDACPALAAAALAFALLVLPGTGCRVVRDVMNVPRETARAVSPGQKDKAPVDPVEVQRRLLRFADEFSERVSIGVDKLQRGTSEVAPAEVLRWKIALVSQTCSIASGPNAVANLLDMTVFVTVTRMALEDHWQPKIFGEAARPMLGSFLRAETNIWQLAGTVLKPQQQTELRQAIEARRQQNPLPEDVFATRALSFASQLAASGKEDPAKSGSIFSLLNLDPLSGLDPATREIAQARLFVERALYVTQKLPVILRWQTELLALNTMSMPPVQQWITNTTEIATSVERFSRMAERLPAQVSTEREEILKALQSQEKGLAALAGEFRQTLAAGSQMSTSLNTTLVTFDALMKRFGVGETNKDAPPNTNSEPFRILDYAQTAAQLQVTARQLTEMLRALDQTLGSTNLTQLTAQVGPVVRRAQTGGKEIVDYAYWKGILFVAIASGIVLSALLVYRFLGARLASTKTK